MADIPIADVLARNMRAARAVARVGQADVAARMNALGFTEWRRQTVARVETGSRRPTAAEIAALALCLDTAPRDLMLPRNGGEEPRVVFPSGFVVSGMRLLTNDGSIAWDENNRPVVSEPSGADLAKLAAQGAERFRQQAVDAAIEKLVKDGWTPPHDGHGPTP